MNNDNDLNWHLRDQMLGWLRYESGVQQYFYFTSIYIDLCRPHNSAASCNVIK